LQADKLLLEIIKTDAGVGDSGKAPIHIGQATGHDDGPLAADLPRTGFEMTRPSAGSSRKRWKYSRSLTSTLAPLPPSSPMKVSPAALAMRIATSGFWR
jgi:hypothetical protein